MKYIFTDLDDTFLYDLENKKNNMYTAPKKSLEAYNEIINSNVKFIIATGRNYGETVELLKRNNIVCDIIVLDGCVTFDKDTHNLVDYHGISNEDTLMFIDLFTKTNTPFLICDDRNYYGMAYQWAWLPAAIADNDLEVTRFIINGESETLKKAKEVIQPYLEQYDLFEYPTNLVLQNKNSSKGKAILRYCKKHNIELDNICVLGDGINDVSMFEISPNSIYINHGKSMEVKNLSTMQADDFSHGWNQLKEKWNI